MAFRGIEKQDRIPCAIFASDIVTLKMKGGNYCMVKTTSTIIRNEGKLLNIILIIFEELGGQSLDIDKFAVLGKIHLFKLCKSGCIDINEIVG